jgi:hypothetical protein
MSFFAAVLCFAITSNETIEKPTDSEFLRLFSRMGFTRYSTSQDSVGFPVKRLKLGANEFFLTWDSYLTEDLSATYVDEGRAQIEFDLPTPLPKMAFANWMKREGLEQISGSSLIGGRIKLSFVLFDKKTTWSTLNQRTIQFLTGAEKVKILVESLGGKVSSSINQFGTAKYDPHFRIDWIERGDLEYLRKHMGWKDVEKPVGDLGQQVPIQVGKVPVYVSGMGATNQLFVATRVIPDMAKVEKFLESGRSIKWADGSVTTSMVRLYSTHRLPHGLTAGLLIDAIQEFAGRVEGLDIL